MKRILVVLISLLFCFPFAGCGGGNSKLLKDKYKDYFDVGVALSKNTLNSYSDEVLSNFNMFVSENEMKWENIHPNEKQYMFQEADNFIEKVKVLGGKARGHVIVWYDQTPRWVFSGGYDKVREKLFSHIDTVVERYKDDLVEWDVANEVLSDSPNPDELFRQDSGWYEACGKNDEKFIGLLVDAFKRVHQIAPDIKLFYNDYNLNFPFKREKAYKLVSKLIEKGAPIDGVGMQAHYDIHDLKISDVEASMDRFISLGVKVRLTELDLSVYKFTDKIIYDELSEELEQKQAEVYGQIFEACRERKDNVAGIVTWGVADDYTWKDNFPVKGRKDFPLLFDIYGEPKMAIEKIMNF